MKNKYEKGIFDFFYKKITGFEKKLTIMLRHFPIGFGLVTIF